MPGRRSSFFFEEATIRFQKRKRRDPGPRANRRIRVPEVRVIDAEGEQLGVMKTHEALQLAMDQGLDLVEVSPTARPPVCRIMDFGRFKYEQSKKQKASKKKQHSTQVKEVKLRPKTEDHDYQFKRRHAEEFLLKHHKVKVTVMFRGREMSYRERGAALLQRFAGDLSSVAQIERPPVSEGRTMVMYLAPLPGAAQKQAAARTAAPGAQEEKKDAEAENTTSSGEAVPANEERTDTPESRVQEPHTHEENDEA